jgi:hypothetical protein
MTVNRVSGLKQNNGRLLRLVKLAVGFLFPQTNTDRVS